jgi:hypothetical protein
MTMTKTTVHDLDERITHLRALVDRATRRLVELDGDLTRQLLEASHSLCGTTAERWADASRRHNALWQAHLAIEAVLGQITELRGQRRSPTAPVLTRLEEMLDGTVVELPRSSARTRPRLTEEALGLEAVSVEEALVRMSADYDVVAGVVADVAEVWGTQNARVQELSRRLDDLEAEVRASGDRLPNDVGATRQELGEMVSAVNDDPLGFDRADLERLGERVGRIETIVADAASERRTRLEDLDAAEVALLEGRRTLSGAREALARSAVKVVVPESTWAALGALEEELFSLERQCESARHLAAAGAPPRDACEAFLVRTRAFAEGQASGLAARDELRGILEAYRAKSLAIGRGEDLDLDALFGSARDLLYTAPCDLDEAGRAVEAYRHAVSNRSEATS